MVQVLIKHKTIYGRELTQVSFGRPIPLNISNEFNFTTRPALDGDCATRCADNGDRAPKSKTTNIAPCRGALQQIRRQNSCGFIFLRSNVWRWEERQEETDDNKQLGHRSDSFLRPTSVTANSNLPIVTFCSFPQNKKRTLRKTQRPGPLP